MPDPASGTATVEGSVESSRGVSRIVPLPLDEALASAEIVGLSPVLAQFGVFRVLLHHPEVAKVLGDIQSTLMYKAALDERLRELLIMRMAWVMGSVYAWSRHWRLARFSDVPHDDLVAVRDWRSSDRFGPAERAVLAATDEILADGAPSAETWAALREHLPTAKEQIEVVTAVGSWRLLSQIIASLEIPLEDDIDAWPPDGVAPAWAPTGGRAR